jgi:hypothetical protein
MTTKLCCDCDGCCGLKSRQFPNSLRRYKVSKNISGYRILFNCRTKYRWFNWNNQRLFIDVCVGTIYYTTYKADVF